MYSEFQSTLQKETEIVLRNCSEDKKRGARQELPHGKLLQSQIAFTTVYSGRGEQNGWLCHERDNV